MFKSWQVFVFSLVPLALVFAGVIGGSFHGLDSEREIFPTPAPRPTQPAGTPSVPGAVRIELRAANSLFDRRTLTVAPNVPVTLILENADPGVLHNFALYTSATQLTPPIFVGPILPGPTFITNEFTSPGPGTYFFRCDAHPDTMTGTFTVR